MKRDATRKYDDDMCRLDKWSRILGRVASCPEGLTRTWRSNLSCRSMLRLSTCRSILIASSSERGMSFVVHSGVQAIS